VENFGLDQGFARDKQLFAVKLDVKQTFIGFG
jgi:hypothetical protein